jgi:hypothetical protein
MTGRDLVSATLRLIGASAPGESIAASEASDGLSSLNRMLDSWSNEGLLLYAVTKESAITLIPGTSTYTLGTGGDITTRPMSLTTAKYRDGSNQEYNLQILTAAEYADIPNKNLQSIPTSLYDSGSYPQRSIVLYPVPSASGSLDLYTNRPLTALTLDDDISLPPGYEEALVYNGAIRLAPEYGRAVSQEIAMVATESKASLKRTNYRAGTLKINDIPAGRRRLFNITTGGYE